MTALVGVIMGSKSDWSTLSHTAEMLEKLGIPHEVTVVSAHRTPDLLFQYAEQAEDADISELMAENLMLKAKLQVEHDRQDALQSALAAQIRELREHIAQEMASLEELRAEQEAVVREEGHQPEWPSSHL